MQTTTGLAIALALAIILAAISFASWMHARVSALERECGGLWTAMSFRQLKPPSDVPGVGPCAQCGKPVPRGDHTWTGNGLDGRMQPLHHHCWDAYYRELAN